MVAMIAFISVMICIIFASNAMCPRGCSCTSDERHIVRCDGAKLNEFPILLDPRTKILSLSNCSLKRVDSDFIGLYSSKQLISFNLIFKTVKRS